MARFFAGLGLIMYHDEPGLCDVVVLNPPAFFIGPATTLVCNFQIHLLPEHDVARRKLPHEVRNSAISRRFLRFWGVVRWVSTMLELQARKWVTNWLVWAGVQWKMLSRQGVLDRKLLPVLWEKLENKAELELLMATFGLMVPIMASADDDSDESKQMYLVTARHACAVTD
eukprot:3050983-Rhodomonas_salina.5